MLILGIDPGSITTGWGLVKKDRTKIHYVASGVLRFKGKENFLDRLTDIKRQTENLLTEIQPDQVSLESLIYVKSPTALIKLAQTRGIILGCLVEKYHHNIFEYSPNFIKSQTVGHGHASKQGVQKFLNMMLGPREYQTHDESDALAIAVCHALGRGKKSRVAAKGNSLKSALAHKVKEL